MVAALEQWKSDETACTSALLVGDDPLVVLSTLIGSMFGDHQRGKVYAGICAAGADPLVTPYALDHALAKVQILTDLYGSVGLPKAVAAQRRTHLYGLHGALAGQGHVATRGNRVDEQLHRPPDRHAHSQLTPTNEEARMVADHHIIEPPRCTSYATCCN